MKTICYLEEASGSKKMYLVSFCDIYNCSTLPAGPEVLGPMGFSNLLSHFLQQALHLSWGRASTLTLFFHSHGTIDNSQSMLGPRLADCIIGSGWSWKKKKKRAVWDLDTWCQCSVETTLPPWHCGLQVAVETQKPSTALWCLSLAELRMATNVALLALWLTSMDRGP